MPRRIAGLSARTRGLLILLSVPVLAAAGFGVHRALGTGGATAAVPDPAVAVPVVPVPAGPRTGDRIVPAPYSATTGSGPAYRLTGRTVVRAAGATRSCGRPPGAERR
ncbi:hypothetical protein [Streptomyces sp. CB01881]|uniref:hypothetical protein n=1 Tax=Streptomyces sp. CB01881 TaxID=2078691 RepID=UPI000CDC603E|nr:hypothetical protein [Streptomyces sp. CB01881]AUY52857.1 hypothetical protein C2142_32540 [Streptomyces sp. CB01881]TYC70574.1 hypothetical protein EH183_32605 [Streptomyces sp. CB01881]